MSDDHSLDVIPCEEPGPVPPVRRGRTAASAATGARQECDHAVTRASRGASLDAGVLWWQVFLLRSSWLGDRQLSCMRYDRLTEREKNEVETVLVSSVKSGIFLAKLSISINCYIFAGIGKGRALVSRFWIRSC